VAPSSLILLFREEVLSRRFLLEPGSLTPAARITDPGYSGTNEVERANILAPGFRPRLLGARLLPAFTAAAAFAA
jgi:hypothetical protein